jgi:predicted TIM-barrel fold metal-dependent hydrolase
LFDFNVHLPCQLEKTSDGCLADELTMGIGELRKCYKEHQSELCRLMQGVNLMLFNEDFPFGAHTLTEWIAEVRKDWDTISFTQLLDFRRDGLDLALDFLASNGVNGIKFHSYVQRISENVFPLVLKAAKKAAARGFFICIDASYGTTRMYDYDNLRLAALLIREIKNVPIIILHSGGVRHWDAMLLALDGPNVYLETSFTLPYYKGSSIEKDLAFIYRKIGIEKVLFASDFPYIKIDEAFDCMESFLERNKFSYNERADIYCNNSIRLISSTKAKIL